MYAVSQEFHEKYYSMYDKIVRITLRDGSERVGLFNDEFYEDSSILVFCKVQVFHCLIQLFMQY